MNSNTPWPDEMVSALKQLWGAGYSAGKIAAQLGVSRSAVAGKINRLGLTGRGQPTVKFLQWNCTPGNPHPWPHKRKAPQAKPKAPMAPKTAPLAFVKKPGRLFMRQRWM